MPRKTTHAVDTTLYGPWTSEVAPAPGDLRLVQAFVNTAARRGKTDELMSPQSLADWLARRRLLPAATELGPEDLERALAVRRGLRALIAANRGAKKVNAGAVGALDRAVASAPLVVRFDAEGSSVFEPAASGLDGALARLVAVVALARLAGRWSRLKLCIAAECRQVLYDASPNRSTKWCTVRCGDRIKARESRRRKKWGDG